MLSSAEHERLNRVLSSRFGLIKDGKPLIRLSWTSDQTEIMVGEHEVYSDGGIYLKTEHGPKRGLKYPGVHDRWVLEKIEPAPSWLPERPYTYELFYIFQDKECNYLEPIEEACCFVATSFLTARYPKHTEKYWQDLAEEEERKSVEYFKELMDNEYPWLVNQLRHGCATVGPRNEYVGEPVSVQNPRVQAGPDSGGIQLGGSKPETPEPHLP